jgi:cytochrome c peroxidase
MHRPTMITVCAMALGGIALILAPAMLPAGQAPPPNLIPPGLATEIAKVEAQIDATFASTLITAATIPNDQGHSMQQIETLGQLLLFDKTLSVNKNTACVFCHMPTMGYTGPISILNATTVSYPGSVRAPDGNLAQTRWGRRKPQSYTYAPYYPALQYNATQADFYGGNFWDLRATGVKLQNPAAEQAQDPPLDPNEHGVIDSACIVYAISKSPYRAFFEQVWGPQAFAITWPANIEQICATPAPAPANDPFPVHLSPADRGRSNSTYDQFGLSIAAYERSVAISPFTSKFDLALANPTLQVLTKDEEEGWELFRGKGKCNTCHLDGTANTARGHGKGPEGPFMPASLAPLFTDFTSNNIGLPKNLAIPYYYETKPVAGFIPNPMGLAYAELGVGAFLRSSTNPNAAWAVLAPNFDGKFQTSTCRNVDMRPNPGFVKAYMHNGYLKSLKEVVHFYNTRDKYPYCLPGSPGEKVTCWPAPEITANLNTTIGNLGLTDKEEDQIVAFLKTLTDGYVVP